MAQTTPVGIRASLGIMTFNWGETVLAQCKGGVVDKIEVEFMVVTRRGQEKEG
jgi:hypothetical protein